MQKRILANILLLFFIFASGTSCANQCNLQGTGGTEWRANEPVLPESMTLAEQIKTNGFIRADSTSGLSMLINDWLDKNLEEGDLINVGCDGNLLSIGIEKKDYEELRTVDLASAKMLALSDVFYDGLDYLNYINDYILFNMDVALSNYGFEYGEVLTQIKMVTENETITFVTGDSSVRQAVIKKAFQGFSADHTNFSVRMGTLYINVGEFRSDLVTNVPGFSHVYFTIPLTKETSPFGL